jgi:hypothetical protein
MKCRGRSLTPVRESCGGLFEDRLAAGKQVSWNAEDLLADRSGRAADDVLLMGDSGARTLRGAVVCSRVYQTRSK